MCGLSGILATLGMLLNDTAILIGAMVLAPILNPVLAFAAGISLLHKDLIIYALRSFFGGIFFVVFISAGFTTLLILTDHTINIDTFFDKFQSANAYLLISAFVSGFSAVYAWLRPTEGQLNLVGVAIAVSLIPFVSFFGMLIGMGRTEDVKSFTIAFVLNLLLIIGGAILAFLGLGFHRVRKEIVLEEKTNIEIH